MKLKQRRWLLVLLVTFILAALICHPAWRTSAVIAMRTGQDIAKGKQATAGNYDIRVNGRADLSKVLPGKATPQRQSQDKANSIRQAMSKLRADVPGARVQFSPTLGVAEVVRSNSGALTSPAPGRNGIEIVRDFLRENAALYGLSAAEVDGLRFLGESVSRKSGIRMVRFDQTVNGVPVFQSETRAVLDRDGRLIRTLGQVVPGAREAAQSLNGLISADRALVSAMASVGYELDAARMTETKRSADGGRIEVAPNHPEISKPATSSLVYFPVSPDLLVPAWSQVTFTEGSGDWYTMVDARTGTLLWRKNIRNHASTERARFRVYVQRDRETPADSPAPQSPTSVNPGEGTQFPSIARTTVNMLRVQDPTASPDGWIPDGGETTTGNNVDAYLDANFDVVPDPGALDNNGRPVGNPDIFSRNRDFLGAQPRNYRYFPSPRGGNPEAGDDPRGAAYQRGAATQLFYTSNWYHDRLHNLGFDEAAGNFQNDTFGRGGEGGDPVLAELQVGAQLDPPFTDNAFFSTPPDGISGLMAMFIFSGPTPDRDSALDAEIVIHELTHGMSNRLIGNASGLFWDVGAGMGEGWSDFYALSLLNNTNADDPNGKYAAGAYATYRFVGFPFTDNYLYGIRRFPYSTDNSINPLTWADVDDTTFSLAGGIAPSPINFSGAGALEVHNTGEIWALSLLEVRSRIIADPAGANGDVPTGNDTMLQIVTDAMKLTPLQPSFTDARDALIEADCAANGCANEKWIWEGFADRGLGYKAVAPLGQVGVIGFGAHMGLGESFSVPHPDVSGVTIDDSAGNNNGAIDPGESVSITVNLFNPWRNASLSATNAAATLSSLTPQVAITDNSSAYDPIPAQSSANGDSFTFQIAPDATCGQSLAFALETTSDLGTFTTNFVLRVGQATGTGTPVTYTRTIPGGLAILDNSPRGRSDTLTITDDLEIADIDFRVDDLTHTWTGDVTAMLRAPNGYGTDLIYLRGIFLAPTPQFPEPSDGDNFVNTVIDDDLPSTLNNDLNLTLPPNAPFTGDWLPAFNSPIWGLFGIPNVGPDPVGQLSRIDTLSTQGDWKIHVADDFRFDTGSLNSWSLIVTPTAYTCSAFQPGIFGDQLKAR